MIRFFSISQKIWLSISILVLGYLFSMLQGFSHNRQTESRLIYVSESLFPASQNGFSALSTFKEQIKYYDDAIKLNDLSIIDVAENKANWCRFELEKILTYKTLDERNLKGVRDAIKLLNRYTSSARTFYEQVISQGNDKNNISSNSEKSTELSKQAFELQRLLEIISTLFSDELRAELNAINIASMRQRDISLYTFIGVVISALTLIFIIIVTSVNRPLKKLIMLEKAVEQSQDGITVRDLNMNNIFANKAWAAMHGYEPDEIIGEKIDIFHTPEQMQNEVIPFSNKAGESGFFIGEINHKRKDGTIFPTHMSVSNLVDENGRIIGHVATASDITQQKLNEEELKKAKAEAEAANKAKSDFLANMSHEIRTPLNGVMGVLNLLLATELDKEQLDLVETGKRSSDSLLTVINDVLDFSKIEAGELDLEIIDFNLRNTIEEVSELPAMIAHDKGVEFIYEINRKVPSFIKGDPGRLRQVLLNLCNNAIKFTHIGEVFIHVSLENETETHAKIRFEVRDTGIGIPEDKIDTVFESFKQTDASTTRQYGGTGLGLSISKKLAELMDGEIGVESRLGKGSTFWFTAVFEKQPDIKEEEIEPPPDIRKKRFILVDDNKTNLEILKGYIEAWDCSCEVASSGEQALSLMNAVAKVNAPFDSAIIDMRMPEMDGAELGKAIKNSPLLKDISLIMLTSQGLRGEASRMKKIGYSAYLTKPIRRSQLYDCLIKVFTNKEHDRDERVQIITKHALSEERRNKFRILIVEDNIVNQKIALRIVEKFGFSADVAANGKEAIDTLSRFKYDITLMDVQMPEMDGFEASRIIRDSQSAVIDHNIPIIAMTAHAMKGDRERCIEAGMDDYTPKPIQPKELLKVIEKYIKK